MTTPLSANTGLEEEGTIRTVQPTISVSVPPALMVASMKFIARISSVLNFQTLLNRQRMTTVFCIVTETRKQIQISGYNHRHLQKCVLSHVGGVLHHKLLSYEQQPGSTNQDEGQRCSRHQTLCCRDSVRMKICTAKSHRFWGSEGLQGWTCDLLPHY